jgi:hypothetical protein
LLSFDVPDVLADRAIAHALDFLLLNFCNLSGLMEPVDEANGTYVENNRPVTGANCSDSG